MSMAQSFEALVIGPGVSTGDTQHSDLDAAWVNIDSDEAESTSSEWDSPQVSPREKARPPADKGAEAPADAAKGETTEVAVAAPKFALPPAPKPDFDLDLEYLPAELESVVELTKERTFKVSLKAASPTAKPLHMFVGFAEGTSLAQAHRGFKWQAQGCRRPLTYDFMKNVVEALGRKVSFVRICASERGVFYARAHFELGKVVHVLDEAAVNGVDSRPSDALNLALRCGAKIYVHRQLVTEAA